MSKKWILFVAWITLIGCAQRPADPELTVNLISVVADQVTIARHLEAIAGALDQALASAESARSAVSVTILKEHIDQTFAVVWGHRSGLIATSGAGTGAVDALGWREQWQTTYGLFDPAFHARYGTAPGVITEPEQLGIVGRGRYLRRALAPLVSENPALDDLLASLNNIIGWQRLDDGVTKAERQPRIDLTYRWDAEQAFWLSEADTGWIFAMAAQAINILKTDYQGNLELARAHTADLSALIRRCQLGHDQNADGHVAAGPMEGGLLAVMQQATEAGVL